MAESMRGMRLGAQSLERDDHVAPAERRIVRYVCPDDHITTMPFFADADEIPSTWECRCGKEALWPDGPAPEAKAEKHVRTHWDMLRERRSIRDLEELLEERLALLHQGLPRSA